jgi:hypothetical protein
MINEGLLQELMKGTQPFIALVSKHLSACPVSAQYLGQKNSSCGASFLVWDSCYLNLLAEMFNGNEQELVTLLRDHQGSG